MNISDIIGKIVVSYEVTHTLCWNTAYIGVFPAIFNATTKWSLSCSSILNQFLKTPNMSVTMCCHVALDVYYNRQLTPFVDIIQARICRSGFGTCFYSRTLSNLRCQIFPAYRNPYKRLCSSARLHLDIHMQRQTLKHAC